MIILNQWILEIFSMIKKVIVDEKIIEKIIAKWLENQYKKVKAYLLSWNYKQLDFKLRQPKKDKIYYFRLNKQFRLWWKIDFDTLKIFFIDNHQN